MAQWFSVRQIQPVARAEEEAQRGKRKWSYDHTCHICLLNLKSGVEKITKSEELGFLMDVSWIDI